MTRYINPQAMADVFAPLELTDDPVTRVVRLHRMEQDFLTRLTLTYQRLTFELSKAGWTLPQIADETGLSIVRVKALIAEHAAQTRQLNPVRSRRSTSEAIDIRRVVHMAETRLRRAAANPPK